MKSTNLGKYEYYYIMYIIYYIIILCVASSDYLLLFLGSMGTITYITNRVSKEVIGESRGNMIEDKQTWWRQKKCRI